MSPDSDISTGSRPGCFKSILVFLVAVLPLFLQARDAPVTTAGSSTVCPGGSVTVPVTVTNFLTVKAITLRLDFDPTKMAYVNYSNLNSALSSATISTISVSPTLSKVIVFWMDVTALSLPNNTKMFDLEFTLLDGSPVVSFNNSANSGGDCEYADELGAAMTDVPTSSFYFDATITNNAIGVTGSITGQNNVCSGAASVPYSILPITNATGYTWSVPSGASIIAGNNTSSITVTYSNSATSGNISVYGSNPCGQSAPATLSVTIHPLPVPAISGAASTCSDPTPHIYSTEPGMTNYIWIVSSGGTILSGGGPADNSVTVVWQIYTPQTVSVNYTNTAGCMAQNPTIFNVTFNPLPVPGLTGPTLSCTGATGVVYSTESGMVNYQWSVSPGGTITSGAATNVIQVSWNGAGAQLVGVNYTDMNGCSAGTATPLNVTVNNLPGPAGSVVGPDTICAGTSGVIYHTDPVLLATSYNWTVPPGAAITSGAGTTQIMVSFGPVPGTGNITVAGVNDCGSGLPSPGMTVAMISSPPAPVVTANGAFMSSSASTGNQWYYEGTGAIPGANQPSYTATVTGWYWTVIAGVGCPSLESNHVYVLFTGAPVNEKPEILVYPVPGDGRFKLCLGSHTFGEISIRITDMLGNMIHTGNRIPPPPSGCLEIDLRPVPPGIYMLSILTHDGLTTRKIVVR